MADQINIPMSNEQRRALGIEIDRLLGDQLSRVRRRFFVHGLGITLLMPAGFLLFAFGLDHLLRLPLPIRVFHTATVTALLVYGVVRFLRLPLSRRFAPVDVAVLVERAFPELHQRLVSTIQLKATIEANDGALLRNQSPAMIEQLLKETVAAARALPLERLLDPTRTVRAWALALVLLLTIFAGSIAAPAVAWIFVQRHIGYELAYPRDTMLLIELPPAGPELQRADHNGNTELTIAAGADLHVSVLAKGIVPTEVFLDVAAGNDQRVIAMQSRPASRFRHVFRRLSTGFTFHARGGDDETGDLLVTVSIVHPPQVATIKAQLKPPAYTQQETLVQSGGAIEALVGTEVSLSVIATDEVETASMVFLESGKRLPLEASTFTDDSGSIKAFIGNFLIEKADRYQIELAGKNGLRNPNPGTYPVTALQDYPPVGRWLLPDDESGTLLLPDALLCMRGEAHDDFGLANGTLTISAGKDRQQTIALATPTSSGALQKSITFVELLDLKQLLLEQRAADGVSLLIQLTDNKEPKPNSTELPRRQAQIVDAAQLFGAIGRNFRSLREEVEQSIDLQTDRSKKLSDLLADQPELGEQSNLEITASEVGQGRIQSTADRLHRGTMRAFDMHLWNRLDASPAAAEVVQAYVTYHRTHEDPITYQPGFYREILQRRQKGTLGAMPTILDPILAMIALCDQLETELAPAAVRTLARAQVARSTVELVQALTETAGLQAKIIALLQDLLGRLDEWNDYQDLVQEARALREKQRDLQNRTEGIRGRK